MNILDLVNNFNTIDIVILVFVIFIFIFLLFLTSSLLKKNKELRCELTRVNNNKNINDEIIVKEEIKKLENKILDKKEIVENTIVEEEDINDILEDLPEITETGPYKKNVLREISARGQTSPVNIGKSTVDVPVVKVTSYVKEEIKEDIKKLDEVDNKTFIEEISKRLEDEMQPQTVELTDYEKKQEEEAIISYQELLKVKDRIYNINDDEEIDSFIDELKEFRTNLE